MVTNGRDAGAYTSEINVTPLVDVVLVLLIIFMMIVPLTLRGYDVDMPGEAVSSPSPRQKIEQVVLEIDVAGCPIVEPSPAEGLPIDCSVRINDQSVPVAELARRVREVFSSREPSDRVLFLAAHEQLNYEGVMRIVDLAESAVDGLKIGLVTDEELAPPGGA